MHFFLFSDSTLRPLLRFHPGKHFESVAPGIFERERADVTVCFRLRRGADIDSLAFQVRVPTVQLVDATTRLTMTGFSADGRCAPRVALTRPMEDPGETWKIAPNRARTSSRAPVRPHRSERRLRGRRSRETWPVLHRRAILGSRIREIAIRSSGKKRIIRAPSSGGMVRWAGSREQGR